MNEIELSYLIDEYGLTKKQLDSVKERAEKLNQQIKDALFELDVNKFEGLEYKVVKSISKRKTIDEDKLLEIIKAKDYSQVIRTREYVDPELLESAIYHGEIDKDTLTAIDEDCTTTKEVITLKVTSIGGNKNGNDENK